jgi:hypothetical protein
MPFGPVTLIFYWPQKKIRASLLISGTVKVIILTIHDLKKIIEC